jgi:hypothetical protein
MSFLFLLLLLSRCRRVVVVAYLTSQILQRSARDIYSVVFLAFVVSKWETSWYNWMEQPNSPPSDRKLMVATISEVLL